MSFAALFFFSVFIHNFPSFRQFDQTLDCYDYAGQSGNSVHLIDYAPDLRQYNFDDMASSCCFNGIWLLYEDTGYNNQNFGVNYFFCV